MKPRCEVGCDLRKVRGPECMTKGVGVGAGGRIAGILRRRRFPRETDGRWQTAIV